MNRRQHSDPRQYSRDDPYRNDSLKQTKDVNHNYSIPPTFDGGSNRGGTTTYFKAMADGSNNPLPRPRKLDPYAKRKMIFERRPKLEPIVETSYHNEDSKNNVIGNGDLHHSQGSGDFNDAKSEISTQTGDSLRLPNGLNDPRLASYNNAAFESPEDLKHSEAALESNVENKKYKKNWRTMIAIVVIIALVAAGACTAAVIFACKLFYLLSLDFSLKIVKRQVT